MCIVYQKYGTFRHTHGDIADANEYSGCSRLNVEYSRVLRDVHS